MELQNHAENRLLAEIEALRAQYADTQDLYREVCVVLFFRHGITPTANKLYQLVRKGSMSAPADALSKFWDTLREKSRVRIEHPDLPQSLRDAAGEVIGALWLKAQAEAHNALEKLREDAQMQVDTANNATQQALEKLKIAQVSLETALLDGQRSKNEIAAFQTDFARVQGELTALQRQVDAGMDQRRELQETLNAAQQQFTSELREQRSITAATEERHASEGKRLLLEVDRERTGANKLQKDLESSHRTLADQAELYRVHETEQLQRLTSLGQRNSVLEGTMSELRGQRDLLLAELADLRLRLESHAPVKKVRSKSSTTKEAKR
jgi:chromosome segregation ATPase